MKILTPVGLSSDIASFQHEQCPSCREGKGRRSQRKNTFERFLSLAYIYPFRCQRCGYRFFKLQWGVRYKKVFYGSRCSDDEKQTLEPLIPAIDQIPSRLSSYNSIIDSAKKAGNLSTQSFSSRKGTCHQMVGQKLLIHLQSLQCELSTYNDQTSDRPD